MVTLSVEDNGPGIEAEAIEFRAVEDTKAVGIPLMDLGFPKGGIIGAITRGEKIIIPRGNDMIMAGDEVIVFALPEAIPEIEALFA